MAEPALLFIPDISGFTRFVTETEVQHANHIISELLSVILESNQLSLQVSEVEGDAVLFYRRGEAPPLDDLLAQIRRTFIDFHQFLKVIDRDRVCQCGACSSASGLTLKFVSHYGDLDEVRVRDFLKLMGRDVILAHRLLKNDVPGNEYALLTEAYLGTQDVDDPAEWARFHPHVEATDDFGEVGASYVPLGPLMGQVPEPLERPPLDVANADRIITTRIEAPAALVHEAIVDFPHRLQWTPGLRDSVADIPMNRVGASHTCVFDDFEVHLVTVDHQASENDYHYAESAEVAGLTFVTDFHLEERDGVTTLDVSQILGGDRPAKGLRGLLHTLKARFLLWNGRRALARSIEGLRVYCESLARERGLGIDRPFEPAQGG